MNKAEKEIKKCCFFIKYFTIVIRKKVKLSIEIVVLSVMIFYLEIKKKLLKKSLYVYELFRNGGTNI